MRAAVELALLGCLLLVYAVTASAEMVFGIASAVSVAWMLGGRA